jgi:broad specificity phosphatase PhoE
VGSDGRATRYLYLARHGEATEDESALTDQGRWQAALLGDRLRQIPLSSVHHGPLPRATETAAIIAERSPAVRLHATDTAGDYVPYVPERADLPPQSADELLQYLAQFSQAERERGSMLAARALEEWAKPVDGGRARHELVVTHTFLIGWLVRHALDAPRWRWLCLSHCHAALTVIRYPPNGRESVAVYNDMSHLPPPLRWTGFPDELRVEA